MALKAGLAAQFGFATETTYGTFAAPSKYIDFISESISYEITRVESSAIRANSRVMRSDDWAAGTKVVSGDIQLELWNKNFGQIFSLMMGSVATTGAATGGVYSYTWSHHNDLPSATIQIGVPNSDTGTVTPWSFTGAMVNEWELSAAVGDPVKVNLSVVAQDAVTNQTLGTASYPSGVELLTFVGGSVSVSGASVAVNSVSLKGSNSLNSERFRLGSQTTRQPLEAALREYTGEFECEFENMDLYNLYVNGTEAALVVTFAGVKNPTHKVTITTTVRFDGTRPQVGGTEVVTTSLPFKAIDSGLAALYIEMRTTDATV